MLAESYRLERNPIKAAGEVRSLGPQWVRMRQSIALEAAEPEGLYAASSFGIVDGWCRE